MEAWTDEAREAAAEVRKGHAAKAKQYGKDPITKTALAASSRATNLEIQGDHGKTAEAHSKAAEENSKASEHYESKDNFLAKAAHKNLASAHRNAAAVYKELDRQAKVKTTVGRSAGKNYFNQFGTGRE